MDRARLQDLAELRLKDAEVLLAAGHWDAAYYLTGYCLECALKACIVQQFRANEVPDKKLVNSFYTHRLDELLVISGLKPAFDAQRSKDAVFDDNWDHALEWSEAARYDVGMDEAKARELHFAVSDPASGLLLWFKKYW